MDSETAPAHDPPARALPDSGPGYRYGIGSNSHCQWLQARGCGGGRSRSGCHWPGLGAAARRPLRRRLATVTVQDVPVTAGRSHWQCQGPSESKLQGGLAARPAANTVNLNDTEQPAPGGRAPRPSPGPARAGRPAAASGAGGTVTQARDSEGGCGGQRDGGGPGPAPTGRSRRPAAGPGPQAVRVTSLSPGPA
jgi:hypothetical protein